MNKVFPHLDEKERSLYSCLSLQHRLGYAGLMRLLEVCETPSMVYSKSSEELKMIYPKLPPETTDSIRRGPDLPAWDKVLERCQKLGANIVAPGSSGYPEPLLALNAPPPLLFVQGAWISGDTRAVAIVGTRNPTAYGRKAAATFARDFVHSNATVVSGLAVGIDAEAHAGALDGEGRTLAVIGCGLDIPYPPENKKLKERIVQSGAVLSEFPPGAHPKRDHFPRRNRILSALAKATVVVEAGDHSGALLTAAHTRCQGGALFAVPGSVFSPASSGTHGLLQRGAFLAACAADVMPALNGNRCDTRIAPAAIVRAVAPAAVENEPVLDLWRGEDTCALDRLVERARETNSWPPGRAMAAMMESLLQLEIRGLIQRLPGPAFKRTASRGWIAAR